MLELLLVRRSDEVRGGIVIARVLAWLDRALADAVRSANEDRSAGKARPDRW